MDGRTCTICDEFKPWAQFSRSILGTNGYHARCKKCCSDLMRARYVPRTRQPLTRVCPQCGEGFTYQPTMGAERTFCSRKCTAAHGIELKRRRGTSREPRRCLCGSADVAGVGIPVCPDCKKEQRSPAAAQRRKERERRRTLALYGLTQAEYEGLVKRQQNRCAICKTTKVGGPPTRRGYWHIDHDHVTGQIRGLLCARCNLGLGNFSDDPELLAAAARYVAKHRQMELFRKAG